MLTCALLQMLYGGCSVTCDAAALVAEACVPRPGAPPLFDSLQVSTLEARAPGWRGLAWLHAPHAAGVARKATGPQLDEVPARSPGTVTRRA